MPFVGAANVQIVSKLTMRLRVPLWNWRREVLKWFAFVPYSDIIVGGAGLEEESQFEFLLVGDYGFVWREVLISRNGVGANAGKEK